MIKIKTESELGSMRRAGKITAEALRRAAEACRDGVTTAQVDTFIREIIRSHGAKPSFLGYRGYPAASCISVNSEVIHGIPGKRRLRDGDLVGIDVGVCVDGMHADAALSVVVGGSNPEAVELLRIAKECFYKGVEKARPSARVGDISSAIQKHAEDNGCSVVRDFTGHGVGHALHEDPEVPNFGEAGHGVRLVPGMTIAIEPMVNRGAYNINVLKDNWTVVTVDGSLSAHYEHTVLITNGEPELLTFGGDAK